MTTDVTTMSARPSVEEVVRHLRGTFATGRTRSVVWRQRQLEGIERLCVERERDVARAIAQDLDRLPIEAWASELGSSRAEAAYARRHLRIWMRTRLRPVRLGLLPGSAWVQPEPLGVVLVIGPWNYPFFLTLGPLVNALAAGNCVVVKPSEFSPTTSALLAQLLPKYLDRDAVAVVEGDGKVAQALLAQGFDHVLFTGGTAIGRKVMAAAASHLSPVTLELGGKSPVFVDEDADPAITARRIAFAKLLNAGQTCIAPDYILAHQSVHDELVEHLAATLTEFRRGRPPGQRIVNRRQFDRLASYLTSTSGRVVLGGRTDPDQLTVEPTVVLDPSPEEPLMREEIFGPILPVLSVASLHEAIGFVNSRPKPLAAYVFSRSRQNQRRFVDEVPAGGVVVNHLIWQATLPTLPFGGVGDSGIGAYHGKAGFDTFTHYKGVVRKPFRPEIKLAYPPYSKWQERILRRLL